jgi:hypothetical protein
MSARLFERLRDERGIALVVAVLLTALLLMVAVSLLYVASGDNSRSRDAATRDGSYQAAEAGLDAYMSDLLANQNFYNQYLAKGEATRTAGGTSVSSSPTSDVSWTGAGTWTYASKDGWSNDIGGGFQYDLETFPPGTDGTTRIVSTGRPLNGADHSMWRAIEMRVRPSSISDFQMLSAVSISYGSGATTYGDIYVTGSTNSLTHDGTSYGNLYADGRVLGSPRMMGSAKKYDSRSTPLISSVIRNPPNFSSFLTSLSDIKRAAQNGGIYLGPAGSTPDAWQLTFLSNGTVQVQSCTKTVVGRTAQNVWHVAPSCGTATTYPIPSNGAIYAEQNAIVSGTVVGRVTVASAANVVVGGNITYADGNVLGLVAQNSIYVGAQTPNNLSWRAATLSQSGSFQSDPDSGNSTTHGTMTFNGSTATADGGSMPLFSARNYLYDSTLRYLEPPWFPTLGDSYTIVVSREVSP